MSYGRIFFRKAIGKSLLVNTLYVPIVFVTLGISSCGGDKDDAGKKDDATESKPEVIDAKASETIVKAKEPTPLGDSPPLASYQLERAGKSGVLVKIAGHPDRQGVLLAGSSGAGRSYVMICDTPEEATSVTFAYHASGTVGISTANRLSRLPSGLSVFGFKSRNSLQVCRLEDPTPGDTFHAIRLDADKTLTDEEAGALDVELAEIRTKIKESLRKREESRRPTMRSRERPDRKALSDMQQMRRERMDAFRTSSQEMADLKASEEELLIKRKMPVTSIKTVEVAAFSAPDMKVKDAGALENTLLASSKKGIVAIRSGGKWLNLKEFVEGSFNMVGSAKINLSGGQSSVSLSCELFPVIPSATSNYVLVAETTFGLESQGSGSIEERLARVESVPFHGRSSSLSISKNLVWGGKKTKLWLKVFDPKIPETLVLDEVILLDYPGTFSARWGKAPSPIIAIAPAEPNQPENLVRERSTLDAKGEILDLVAAGDGSVLMVRTNREPFWATLDLKTGKWLSTPWKATADTLVATQAGKIQLINSKSMVMETWGLASGKREGLQILPLSEPIVAVAAPLTDANQPMMVVTAKGAYFLDAVDFELISCGLDTGNLFDDGSDQRNRRPPLDPATISVRASDEGVLYGLSGRRMGEKGKQVECLTVTVDRSPLVVKKDPTRQFIGSKGRHMGSYFSDHGGGVLKALPSSSGARFPDSSGEIRITDKTGRSNIAVLENPPVFPEIKGKLATAIAADRGIYLDSGNGVLLLPDGEKIHIIRLSLPKFAKPASPFLLTGESLEISLPPGTGHRLTSTEGGETEIDGPVVRWTSPDNGKMKIHRLKLEWIGELGSEISSEHPVSVIPSAPEAYVESPDGTKKISLHRRGVINGVESDWSVFAGSGYIALSRYSGMEAWNLWTCEKIFSSKERCQQFFGDADHMYSWDSGGKLISYDILTGEKLTEASLGRKIRSIATGMSSRDSLLAVEQNGTKGFLIQISRNTLKTQILDLSDEICGRLIIPKLASNASGSAAWTRGVGIFSDGRAITVIPYPTGPTGIIHSGVPDAYGQQVVDGKKIINLKVKPLVMTEVSGLPGMDNNTICKLDASGRYLLLSGYDDKAMRQIVSVRDVRKPNEEIFKICQSSGNPPLMISGSKTLVSRHSVGGKTMAFVYDLDVPKILGELSR